MIFGKRLTRAAGLGLVVGALAITANAQNESNFHPASNDFDGFYLGLQVGGGLVTTADGAGRWIPGEELRGSRKAAFSGDFGFKVTDYSLVTCMLGGTSGWSPLVTWWEYDGRNPNRPDVFTNPTCLAAGLVMGTASGAELGTPPGSSASVLAVGLPTGIGTATVLIPNNGLLPTTNGGTLTLIAAAGIVGGTASLPTGCYSFQVGALTTIVPSLDDIDGWWVWHQDNADAGASVNYYGFSFDEPDVWQSNSLHGALNGGAFLDFPATTEFHFNQLSLEAATTAALAPAGSALVGEAQYYGVTLLTNSGFGGSPPFSDPNGGYDVGAGSQTISLGGTTGYADFNDVLTGAPILASQDPGGSSGVSPTYVTPTLGFHTWDTRDYNDNGIADDGGEKVTLVTFNWDMFGGANPDASGDVLGSPGTRLPVTPNNATFGPGGDFPQALTLALLPLLRHTVLPAPAGWLDPNGFPAGAGELFDVGTSNHLPSSGTSGTCFGVEIAMTYGTVTLVGGNPTYNPQEGSTSGRKVLFVLD